MSGMEEAGLHLLDKARELMQSKEFKRDWSVEEKRNFYISLSSLRDEL